MFISETDRRNELSMKKILEIFVQKTKNNILNEFEKELYNFNDKALFFNQIWLQIKF